MLGTSRESFHLVTPRLFNTLTRIGLDREYAWARTRHNTESDKRSNKQFRRVYIHLSLSFSLSLRLAFEYIY